ncbi:putative mg2+ transporter zinc transport protein [Eutypa lata UCREL1]|uniref:Putative mg2+ transporter zinc transport protein n=1 Tax=Eutypa lata (strain UCR-EL1) TaxID=1287681 RepID=M7TNH7_EUTLA|nr:putative mg2+ transporter zinc transport protein [Eutypa lata UCREL1]
MEEKLESVQLEVSKWETREKDRGKEKPRWTRNDERKYGATIKKLVRSTNKQIRELHSVYTSVKSLKETLVRSQEQIRADLSLRGSEDIRFFTYVTVVFLPLGFASSIFSMNGNPGSDLVTSLVICATIALLITVFALVNAKTLGYFSATREDMMKNMMKRLKTIRKTNMYKPKMALTRIRMRLARGALEPKLSKLRTLRGFGS